MNANEQSAKETGRPQKGRAMTRQEIIELMARAMGDDTNRGNGGWSGTNDKDIYRSNAREILARLKSSGLAIVPIEPSEKMVGASKTICIEEMARSGIKPERIKTVIWTGDKEYRAMITAAIKEQEGRDR